jgi:hypothetical protein
MSLTLIIMSIVVGSVVLRLVWTLIETIYELWDDYQTKKKHRA